MTFIEAQMSEEGYASASEFFRTLVREEQRRRAKRELEQKLAEGLQGTPVAMSRGDWNSIRQEAINRFAGEQILHEGCRLSPRPREAGFG